MRDSAILGENRPKCKITYQAFYLVEQKSRIVTRAAKDINSLQHECQKYSQNDKMNFS